MIEDPGGLDPANEIEKNIRVAKRLGRLYKTGSHSQILLLFIAGRNPLAGEGAT